MFAAFISANLAATEILGMAANSAQYGAYTVHGYWIGAFLLLRFDRSAHLLSSILFAFAAILIAGVNLYAPFERRASSRESR